MSSYIMRKEDEFWSKVDRHPTECWGWTGTSDRDGYGLFGLTLEGYRTGRAHRAAWVLCNGPIPAGAMVLHNCDNPTCVRPSHLRLGTNSDNMRDKFLRFRHSRQRLSPATVLEIRSRHGSGEMGYRRLSKEYGVHRNTIKCIITRENWKYI